MDGQMYRRSSSKGERSYWRCTVRKCLATVVLLTKRGRIVVDPTHSHPPRHDFIEKRKIRFTLAAMAKESQEPAEVLLAELGITEGADFVEHVKYVNNLRQRTTGIPKVQKEKMINVGHDYETITSMRDKKMIVKDGYVFRSYLQNKAGDITYWRCDTRECRVRARVLANREMLIAKTSHNHGPQAEKMATMQNKTLLKNAAMDLTQPLVEIFAEFEVNDAKTRKFVRHIRRIAERNSNPLEVETALEIPSDMLELSISDLNVPPLCFPTPTLEDLTQTLVEPEVPKPSEPSLAELADVYSIDEILNRMGD